VTAGAVTALDVAARRNGKVDAAVFMVVAAEAGMALDFLLSGTTLCHGLSSLLIEKGQGYISLASSCLVNLVNSDTKWLTD
jgi:hypothetical protein